MPGFLKLYLCERLYVCVFACVCPTPKLRMTSGMMWCDIDPYDWSNKFYHFYMASVVIVVSGHGVSIHACHGNYPNKSKLAFYKLLLYFNNCLR